MKKFLLATALGLTFVSAAAFADAPGKHPYYLHALSDLRAARWMLQHRAGDKAVTEHENAAVKQIDGAINDIKKASIDDGKDINEHPQVDAPNDQPGRLHKAKELLDKVHSDVGREEDDPAAKGLKHDSLKHIDKALEHTNAAIWAVEHHK